MTRLQGWDTTKIVAAREIRQRVRGRPFRIATALVVLGVAAAIIIPSVVGSSTTAPQRVGVIGTLTTRQDAALATAARGLGVAAKFKSVSDRAAADRAVAAGRLDVVIDDGVSLIVATSITADDTSDTANLARAFASALGTQAALTRAGLTPRQVATLYAARPVPIAGLHGHPPTTKHSTQAASTVALIVLFLLLSQYLTWTLLGVMEEKSNRVVEVLLAALRPLQLLTGKLIGIGVTVFVQAAVVAVVAVGAAIAVGSDVLHGASGLVLGSTVLWLLVGYAFLSWVYAAAGSLVERQDQVQSLAIPLVIPLVVAYITAISAVSSGHSSTFLVVLAYLPPTAPFAMSALVALGAVTWWQFALSVLVTLAATVATARLAATVYRRAVLRTGTRVRLREVLGAGVDHARSS